MAADYKRIHRLLKIYSLIQGDNGWTAERLAEEFKTSQRTIFRDIDVLRSLGMPLFHDPDRKCYQIGQDFYMPPLELTFEESLALISLGRNIHDNEQIPFSRPALKALAKIRGQLPTPVRRELDLLEGHLCVRLAASAAQEAFEDCYDKTRRAISTRTCLRCRYESASGQDDVNGKKETNLFLLKPYSLLFSQRAWYVVGHHSVRDYVRTFKLNRFSEMQATSNRYELPKNFSLEKHLGNAWRMIRGDKTYRVELEFDTAFAETISDTIWHRTQEFEHMLDGSLRWKCTVDGLSEIVWWILGMGAHCKVIQPPELLSLVKEESARMMALYSPTRTQSAVSDRNSVRAIAKR